ncbi:MAG TPA: T9SS type A sorting domain-containing protein, partial [Bacteroidales bacterium]|nr:T9SS type A sorting domain-containing protein [Bacteroidales bacterium]
ITHVTCFGASTGAIDLIPSGGTPFAVGEGYVYAWSGPNSFSASTQDITGVPAGDYNVTVSDSTGCSEIFGPFTVEENPEIMLTVNTTSDLLCNGDDNGTADITASGGTGSYNYAWTGQNTGKTSDVEDPADLPADIYDLVITDGTDCSKPFASAVTITEPEVLAINSVDQVDVLCNGDNTGSFTINAAGGTTPYLYSSDGVDFRSSAQFNNLDAGTYSTVVRDKNDCVVEGTDITISQPEPLVSSLSSKTDVVCYGENTGSLEVTASGGSAPYQYSIDGGTTNQEDNGLFDALTADTYDVTITDANGCTTVHSNIDIAQPPIFDVIVNKTDVLCFGRDNGNFTLTGTGGTSPYEYSIDDGQTFTTTASYFFLKPDTFEIQVKDANGCLITDESVIISEPDSMEVNDVLVTDLKCFEEGTGSMLVRVKGGSKPYQYALNTGSFQTDSLFEELPTGAYSITVADAWGCVATGTASVSQPDQLLLETSSTEPLCRGENTGTITATPSGGIPPFTYSLDSTEFVEDSVFTGFYAGKYTIHVLDSNSCHVKDTNVVVDPKEPLTVEIVSFTNVLPTEPGEIVAEASGGTAPYYYTLMPGNIEQADNGTFEITRDNIGTYTVEVDDENGCGPVMTDEISIVGFAGSSLYREFSVYPNPTTGVVTIEFSTDNKEVELDLIGLDGKQFIEKKVYSSDGKVMEKINIGDLEKGIYFIRLDNHAMPTGVVLK